MTSSTVAQLLEEARADLKRVTPAVAQRETGRGALLVDTRCAELRERDGLIPDAAHVPLSVLFWRLDPGSRHRDRRLADPSRRVILFCEHGYSSSLAAATLQRLGYAHATDVVGGFAAWRAAGLPVTSAGGKEPTNGPRPPQGGANVVKLQRG